MISYVVSIGKKARQGKDFSAQTLKNRLQDLCLVEICHFASELKRECSEFPDAPLIFKEHSLVNLRSVDSEGNIYYLGVDENSPIIKPFLEELEKRGVDAIYPTKHKDSVLLQLWGTNYRRKFFSEDYWVKKLLRTLESLERKSEPVIVIIPDTRFSNELLTLHELFSPRFQFLEIQRLTTNGEMFVDPDRDPNHPSECGLEHMPDSKIIPHVITAQDGDLQELTDKVLNFCSQYLVPDILSKELMLSESVDRLDRLFVF